MSQPDVNGVHPLDTYLGEDRERMAVMDRLLEFAPPTQQNADEAHARMALYGDHTRSGSVAPATPRHLRHSVQRCTTDPFNNDDPAGFSGRVV